MEMTLPGTPSFLLLKSTFRYIWRDPPPRLRVVILPRLLRPACLILRSSNDFSGLLRVSSSKEGRTALRVPGVTGLRFFNGIYYFLKISETIRLNGCFSQHGQSPAYVLFARVCCLLESLDQVDPIARL